MILYIIFMLLIVKNQYIYIEKYISILFSMSIFLFNYDIYIYIYVINVAIALFIDMYTAIFHLHIFPCTLIQ